MSGLPRSVRPVSALLACTPAAAWAHAFDNRYDLPAPLSYFVAGATAAVALSFAVTALVARRAPATTPGDGRVVRLGALASVLATVCRAVSVALLVMTIVAGLYGTRDPVMNLAPTLVWIVFWAGLSLAVACIGNVWTFLDPWRAIFDTLDALARRLGRSKGAVIGWRYPGALGAWPAVVLLLAIGWLEVVYPESAEPHRLAAIALAWSVVTLLGRIAFGPAAWERNADVFAIYFATLGRFAPVAAAREPQALVIRPPGRALTAPPAESLPVVAFVLAMLATVLFDGLLSGEAWPALQAAVTRALPLIVHERGYGAGTLGLLTLWLLFLGGYMLACTIASRLVGEPRAHTMVLAFALTLVPIAVAYNVAHNFSSLVTQGQQLIPLLSDPLGRRWDLLGTAGYTTRIGLVDARTTWYVAIAAIVAGHVVSIWLAHRVALRELGTARRAIMACSPLTVLMLVYTAVSLSVIAEPMVKFGEPTDSTMMRSPPQAVRAPASSSAWCTRPASIGCCLSRTPVT